MKSLGAWLVYLQIEMRMSTSWVASTCKMFASETVTISPWHPLCVTLLPSCGCRDKEMRPRWLGTFVTCPGSGGTLVRVATRKCFSVAVLDLVCTKTGRGGQSQSISHHVGANPRPEEPTLPQMARQWLGLVPASNGTLGLSNIVKPGHQ